MMNLTTNTRLFLGFGARHPRELRANAYIVKPIDFHPFTRVVQSMEAFWLGTVRLPMRSDETVSEKQGAR